MGFIRISGGCKIRGTILEVRIIRIIMFWGLFWGPLSRELSSGEFSKGEHGKHFSTPLIYGKYT